MPFPCLSPDTNVPKYTLSSFYLEIWKSELGLKFSNFYFMGAGNSHTYSTNRESKAGLPCFELSSSAKYSLEN